MTMAALIIAMNIPFEGLTWDSSLFFMLEIGIIIITLLTFFISAHTRGSRSYIIIGIGALLAFAGRNILLISDTWVTLVPGFLVLSAGTWLICARLRHEHLWI